MIKNRKRLWALLLSAALIVTQLPAVAMAENATPEDGSIASFEELPSGVANQTVDVGTELSALNLPDTVTATIYHVTEDTVIPDEDNIEDDGGEPSNATPSDADKSVSDNNVGDTSVKDSGKTVTAITTSEEQIPVSWDSEPAYDGETEGSYVFTADVGGYVLSDGAKLPKITVTVGAESVEQPTGSQPGETLPCTQTEGCTLPDRHEGDCVPAPLANDGLVKTITSWTFVATDYSGYMGNELAIPNASMEQQADFDMVVSMLPTQLSAAIEGEIDPATVDIIGWTCPEYIQDGEGNWPVTGDYTFTVALPEGYACEPLPTIKVLLGGANTFDANKTIQEDGLTVTASEGGEVEYIKGSGFTLKASGTYEISGEWNWDPTDTSAYSKQAVITVPAGVTANVTLRNVTINVSSLEHACAFRVEAGGTANIILDQDSNNTLTSGHSRAGLEVPETATVRIGGDGSLMVTGGASASGIGGSNGIGYQPKAGNIIIYDGTIEATGGSNGAGIGGGYCGIGGIITISGGTVTAQGGVNGAGIGGGFDSDGRTITISSGTVTAKGGESGAGIGGGCNGDGGTITISGGTVTAIGNDGSTYLDSSGAGIGGGRAYNGKGNGGTIAISGGTVTAKGGNSGAGIGGGGGINGGDGGHITISGGIVEAEGIRNGAGIGGGGSNSPSGNSGSAGTIEINGNTVVFSIAQGKGAHIGSGGSPTVNGANSGTFIKGVVFEGEQGTVHGSPTLPGDVTIPSGSTLTVPDGSTFTIPGGTTLTNDGTVENHGTVTGEGSITNNGTINDHSGGISVTVTGTEVNKPSKVEVSFWNSQNGQITQATYGDTIKITATAQRKATNTLARGAVLNKVDFYIGTISPEHRIGTADVATSSSTATATLEITLSGEIWSKGVSLGVNTIIADFGGTDALSLLGSTGTADLAVEMELSDAAAKITAPATGAMPEATAMVDGSAGYTAGTVTWSGALTADGKFDYDTAYTAEITLNAKQYYRFANPVTGAINGQTANVSRKSNTEVVLSYTFGKTAVQQTWAVTVENGTSDKATAAVGETVAITAGSAPAGQTFDKWTTADGVTFANENAASTTFIMPARSVTVTATYKNSGGSSSGGGGRSTYSEPEPQSIYTVMGNNISQSVSRSDLKKLADSGKSLTLRCDKAGMTFAPAALNAILAAVPATAGNITFSAAPSDLNAFPDAVAQIGTCPVYDFTISHKGSKGNTVKADVNFPAGTASITLSYTPAAVEVTGSLFMVYVNGAGAVTWLDKSSYKVNDAEGGREGALGHDNGKVLAEVPHFSTYGVAYKAPAPVFTDIGGHWAKADIEFVAARGLLSGTENNLFSPDGTMTRGMFVTALGRLAGVTPDSYQTRSFTDVKADAYYAAYVEWAAQKNIVKGTGEGLFSPDTPVTREQMAVMMVNYAGQMGYSIPTPLAAVTFADNDRISAWAAKEVAAMQRAGIIKGRDGNRFDPQASATRAEVSAVLRRFVEIVIDPVTAQGWGKNDSGQWLYYKDGKALTGWKQIGSKWYYFDKNGIMAVNTKIDGYEIGPDGARKDNN